MKPTSSSERESNQYVQSIRIIQLRERERERGGGGGEGDREGGGRISIEPFY